MTDRMTNNQVDRLQKIENLIDYVQTDKDGLHTRRIVSSVFGDQLPEGARADYFDEFKARLSRSTDEQLDYFLSLLDARKI